MGETRGDHSIDIAINSGDTKPCIFKVPDIFRRHSPKSFTPNSFSFGPLHCPKEHLKETEVIKQHYLAKLLTRKPTPRTTLEEFKRSILEVEERARKCYAFPTNHLDKNEFVGMLVLDGCFIIELLRNNEIETKKNDNKSSNNNNNNNNNNSGSINNNKNNSSSSNSINNDKNNNISSNNNNNNTLDEDDPVFSVSWVLQVLYHDLILLENQIPWFVLERLFDMTTSPTISDSTKSLTELALDFFATIFSAKPLPKIDVSPKINHILDLVRTALVYSSGTGQQSPAATSLKESGIHKNISAKLLPKIDVSSKINHILDLIKNSSGSSPATGQKSVGDWQQIPTATSLKEAGIRFKKGESSNLLDITFEFKHGVLEIPSLLIQETTCEAFRNLISYEQCYPNCEAKITSYAVLLNNLINTTEDIKVLHEADIVDNWLNPNDTLEFFKNIYTDTYVKKFYYVEIYQQVKTYRNRIWPRTRAAVVHNIFVNPLIITSEIVAGIAVFLTLLQTVYTMKQYKKDSSHSPSPSPPPHF